MEGDEVTAAQRFLHEPYANPIAPFAFLLGIISRSKTAPWLSEETIGTVAPYADEDPQIPGT